MTVESLTPIKDTDLLAEVKKGLNMQGNDYQDDTVSVWIEDVKQYILNAGATADVVGSTLAVGVITKGVDDIYVSHKDTYSDMFYQGVERLRNVEVVG